VAGDALIVEEQIDSWEDFPVVHMAYIRSLARDIYVQGGRGSAYQSS
jgi:hypothetical protein